MATCKICSNPALREKVDDLLRKGVKQVEIAVLANQEFPQMNLTQSNISYHYRKHMLDQPEPVSETTPSGPEVTLEEIKAMPRPDLVQIIEDEVNKYLILSRRRTLTPSEELQKTRFVEFLIKVELSKLEPKPVRERQDTVKLQELIDATNQLLEAKKQDGPN
jgi:hypothetical protein